MELPDYLEKLKIEKHRSPTIEFETNFSFLESNPRLFHAELSSFSKAEKMSGPEQIIAALISKT